METKMDKNVIQGVLDVSYLVGDPGDGVTRKILLFFDINKRFTPINGNAMTMANLFRFISTKKCIDLFTQLPLIDYSSVGESDSYMSDFLNEIKKDPDQEPMRVHRVDIRSNISKDSFIYNLFLYLSDIANGKECVEWKQSWPTEDEILSEVNLIIEGARLNASRLWTMYKTRDKFITIIIIPLMVKWTDFLSDETNKNQFSLLQSENGVTLAKEMLLKINLLYSESMDAYFLARMLKRSSRVGDMSSKSLQQAEPMTHIMGYFDLSSKPLEKQLILLGFKLRSETYNAELHDQLELGDGNQNLPFSKIDHYIRNFYDEKEDDTLPELLTPIDIDDIDMSPGEEHDEEEFYQLEFSDEKEGVQIHLPRDISVHEAIDEPEDIADVHESDLYEAIDEPEDIADVPELEAISFYEVMDEEEYLHENIPEPIDVDM